MKDKQILYLDNFTLLSKFYKLVEKFLEDKF